MSRENNNYYGDPSLPPKHPVLRLPSAGENHCLRRRERTQDIYNADALKRHFGKACVITPTLEAGDRRDQVDPSDAGEFLSQRSRLCGSRWPRSLTPVAHHFASTETIGRTLCSD